MVLWGMTILLIIALYYDLFRKVLEFGDKINLPTWKKQDKRKRS
jgi:hypothetical protein